MVEAQVLLHHMEYVRCGNRMRRRFGSTVEELSSLRKLGALEWSWEDPPDILESLSQRHDTCVACNSDLSLADLLSFL